MTYTEQMFLKFVNTLRQEFHDYWKTTTLPSSVIFNFENSLARALASVWKEMPDEQAGQ